MPEQNTPLDNENPVADVERDVQSNADAVQDPAKYAEALKKRVDEAKAALAAEKQARKALEDQLSAREAANQKKLQERGEYEQLYKAALADVQTLKGVQTEAESLREVIQNANALRIQQIPEDRREVVPDGLSATQLSTWLDKSLPILTRKPAPDIDAGVGGNTQRKEPEFTVTDADRTAARIANASGYTTVTPESIAKTRANKNKQ